MEPLGIVASIIAVFQASDRALNLLSSFNRARNALQELEDLRTSITAVRLVFAESPNTTCRVTDKERCPLCTLVRNCDQILLSMENLLLENHEHAGKMKRTVSGHILRARWLKRRPRIDSLKLQLRDSIALLTLHATLNSPTCTRQRENRYKATTVVDETSNKLVSSQLTVSKLRQDGPSVSTSSVHMRSKCITKIGRGHHNTVCSSLCQCACHRQIQWHIPVCQGRLGYLFVKSTGFMLRDSAADSPKKFCLHHDTIRATVVYISPRWLPYFGFCMTFANSGRPQFGLSCLRLQRPDSEFCMSIRNGDCLRIYQLLTSGEGHIADIICPYGISVLQLAFQSGQRDVCRLLVGLGAEEDPAYSRWSHNDLWDYIVEWARIPCSLPFSEIYKDYCNYVSPKLEAKDLMMEDEFVVSLMQTFSRFHKSILNLSSESLQNLCETAKHEIDEVDSLDRTPLFWAVRRGHLVAVQTLLNAGADPNISDKHGQTPVHVAAASGFVECLQALADAKANLEARNRLGVSPVVYASTSNQPQTLELLLDLGADCESVNTLGETALSYANMAGNIQVVKVLLSRGASIENVDAWGYIPILDAVLTNFYKGLSTYVMAPASVIATRLKDGQTILHIAARNADAHAMEILLRADLSGLHTHLKDASGYTAMEYFLRRKDSEHLTSAFIKLMAKAGTVNNES